MSGGSRGADGGLGMFAFAAVIGYVILSARLGIPFAIPVGVVGAVAAMVALRGPLGRAIANRIQGIPPGQEGLPPPELLNELDELRARVAELEERMDFSERLLAQSRELERSGGAPPG